ncbi:glycoside hydrolase family 113 [Pseudoxanthomonas winnipegensis]|nr:glycosidase-like protein [Pseudoxanthomonas winnipegensis]
MSAAKKWAMALLVFALASGCSATSRGPWLGANVKVSEDAPWGSKAAGQSLRNLADAGAQTGLLVAFLWQETPASQTPVLGSDSSVERLRDAVRQTRAAGLRPILKLHVWVPGHWAGEIDPADKAAWFAAYEKAILPLAAMAREERVEALVLGTELRRLQNAPQWTTLATSVRKVYPGRLVYVADSIDQAEAFPYWSAFDVVGTSLYPALPSDLRERGNAMNDVAARLQALSERQQRPAWVAELGLRSASGSLGAPWESPEQRTANVDLALQARVLGEWKQVLARHGVVGIGIWCWYTDPAAGGASDSDFTVQNKPAQAVFRAGFAPQRSP